MYATCSICGDIFTGTHPEVIHSTPCGHLFHYVCLVEWLQRSKTCPQCRSRVSEEKTIKLYFQISANQLSQDAGGLENELQNVKFKLTLQNLDIKKLNEENEKAKSQAEGLRKKVKQREEEIRNHETVVSALQEKIKVMKSQLKSLTEVELKAAELAAKLEQFESVERILKGTAQQATEQLDSMKDKDTSTLCTCISTLKKEIDQYKEKNKYMQNQLRKTEKELSSCFAEIDKLRAVNSVLSRAVEQYKSPSNDKMNSSKMNNSGATKKVMTSSNLPRDLSLFDDLDGAGCSKNLLNKSETSLSNKRTLVRCEEDIMIDLDASPVKKPYERASSQTSHVPSPRSPIKLSRLNELRNKTLLNKTRIIPKAAPSSPQCYDGLGGHLKDTFSTTDRATLIREVEDRKPNKLQLPRKRLKTSLKNAPSGSILQFCSKRT